MSSPTPWTTARLALGMTDRPEQTALFDAVLADPERVVGMDGPTGIGKSALVAALAVLGRPVTYVARTKAQQRQMAVGMAPAMVRAGLIERPVMLFGRSEYICLRRAGLAGRPYSSLGLVGDGSRANYPGRSGEEWARICSDPEDSCSRKVCGEQDARNLAVEAAAVSDLVITNQNLLVLSAIIGDYGPLGLTAHRTLCVDEAHEFADVVADSFGAAVSALRLVRVANLTGRVATTPRWGRLIENWRDTLRLYEPDELWQDHELAGELAAAVELTRSGIDRRASPEHAAAETSLAALVGDLTLLAADDEDHVRHVENPTGRVPKALAQSLLTGEHAQRVFGAYHQAYVMSATLDGLPAQRLWIEDVHVGDSPFDLAGRRLGYVTSHRSKDGNDWQIDEIAELIHAVGGGHTLVLCTSHFEKRRVADAVKAAGFRVAVQPDDSTAIAGIVDQLRDGSIDVLIGVDAMGTGIDIPGRALQLVIVLKYPIPPYKRAYLNAMGLRVKAQGLDPWRHWFDEIAMTKARQQVGRLVRTVDDHGVVALMDPRSRYHIRFERLLRPSSTVSTLDAVRAFTGRFQ